MVSDHAEEIEGLPVRDYDPDEGIQETKALYRVGISWDDAEDGKSITDVFARLLEDPRASKLPGLVIGSWGNTADAGLSSEQIIEAIVAAREQLPDLKILFLGDITYEECEISWIQQSDVSPLLNAYPQLAYFRVRGGEGLVLGRLRHDHLRALIIESGGLGGEVVRALCACQFPKLEHLELWLGSEGYGGTTSVADLEPLLSGSIFPSLRYLGLRDCEIADEVAAAVAKAPILERIKVLDLSLGNLGDDGAKALLESPAVARLEKLDLHHHFVSPKLVKALSELGIEVVAGKAEKPHDYGGESQRYIAVSE